jgi:hypothetical protein
MRAMLAQDLSRAASAIGLKLPSKKPEPELAVKENYNHHGERS